MRKEDSVMITNLPKKDNYKCPNCGAVNQFSITVTRHIDPIYDGYIEMPIGWDDQGSSVSAKCTNCDHPFDCGIPNEKGRGIIFEKR